MMIIMRADATPKEIDIVVERVQSHGLRAHISTGEERTIIGAIGEGKTVYNYMEQFRLMDGVDRVVPISRPYKLASREFRPEDSLFPIDGVQMGTNDIVIIAGPCSVENRSQLLETAQAVREAGAHALRGGVFKPRTSPYSFQGLGEAGLELMVEAREQTGLPLVTEVMREEQIPLLTRYVDVLQVGARNMQNYGLAACSGREPAPGPAQARHDGYD